MSNAPKPSWAEVEKEWYSYAMGCSWESAPNPDEYIKEYYPERLSEFEALPRYKRLMERGVCGNGLTCRCLD